MLSHHLSAEQLIVNTFGGSSQLHKKSCTAHLRESGPRGQRIVCSYTRDDIWQLYTCEQPTSTTEYRHWRLAGYLIKACPMPWHLFATRGPNYTQV
eukprot:scaffold267787_cov20-Prasinocladus_malaysianus.AAC.1